MSLTLHKVSRCGRRQVSESRNAAVLHTLIHLRDDMEQRYASSLRLALAAVNVMVDGGYFPFVPERYVEMGMRVPDLCCLCSCSQHLSPSRH